MDPSARCGIPLAVTVPSELVDRITLAVREQLKAEGFLNGVTASPLLTVDETASYLRCSRQAVYDRVHQGAIVPLRDGRRLLFRRSALDAYLERRLP